MVFMFQLYNKSMVIRASLIIVLANVIGGGFNYLYHINTARFLSTANYGLFESLLSLNYFFSILVSAFSLSIIKFVNALKKNGQQISIAALLPRFENLTFKLTFLLSLCFVFTYPFLVKIIDLPSFSLFLFYSLQTVFMFFPVLYSSIIRAQLKFVWLSVLLVLTPLTKYFLSFFFLRSGYGINGAILALSLSSALTAVVGLFLVQKLFGRDRSNQKKEVGFHKKFWSLSRYTLLAQLGLISLYSSDVILARKLMTAELAGQYAAISILGKIILFASTSILTVIFPLFTKVKPGNKKSSIYLMRALLATALLSFMGVLFYRLFPDFIIKLSYAGKYVSTAAHLTRFACLAALLSFFSIIIYFLTAHQSKIAALVTTTTAILQIVLLNLNNSGLSAYITSSIWAVGFGIIFSTIFVIKLLRQS